MFADTDVAFSQSEFENSSIYNNANTAEKLVRMEDSIRRGIDLYYNFVSEYTQTKLFTLKATTVEDVTTYENLINLANETTFGFPTRIDALFYILNSDNTQTLAQRKEQIDFVYDEIAKTIFFVDKDYTEYEGNVKFFVWYKIKKTNIPYTDVDEITYDLDTLNIPSEVQRMLPFYVKSELYEEDEPAIAMMSKNTFIQFLTGLRKKTTNNQTKVKRARVFDK